MSSHRVRVAATLVVASFITPFLGVAPIRTADARIGLAPPQRSAQPLASSAAAALTRTVAEYGRVSLSLDAVGTTDSSGILHVDKPAGATVRRAFLMAVTSGFTFRQLTANDVTLLDSPVAWNAAVPSNLYSWNYWADVTALVKPFIDAAPAGLVELAVGEAGSLSIDGETLAVIFDDPNKTVDSSVFLYFGAQNPSGDRFVVDLGDPISMSLPGFAVQYSLGISYGYIASATLSPAQFSVVEVNGRRLTTSAGGQDDGASANGALITVGGIGDSTANPSDPDALPTSARDDDERYDLLPFLQDGDTSITIDTYNPSGDDNIFLAALEVSGRSVVAVDLDIALHNNPGAADRALYEEIIGHFADALYESSNGARKLGHVTFHTGGVDAARAHVLWTQRCHPSAPVSGYSIPGLHIHMCDVFRDGAGPGVDYDFLASPQARRRAGYALAHEWGHYFFSLYDEFAGDSAWDATPTLPHSTDQGVPNSIMNDPWQALDGDFSWLNFSVPKNDAGRTAQFRVYGASGWSTLARPAAQDPRTGALLALPARIIHPDLAAVAPADAADAALDLPGPPGADARSALHFVWQSQASDRASDPELQGAEAFTIGLTALGGVNLPYPAPLTLLAFASHDQLLTGLSVTATVIAPTGVAFPLRFHDDGVAPDARAGDGLYAAIAPYSRNGLYRVRVIFDNDARAALRVSSAFQPAAGIDGSPVALDAPQPFTATLRMTRTLGVVVSGFGADDHGNAPAAASPVPADDTPAHGRIDYAGDADVFSFTVPYSGAAYARVTATALGMEPRIRVYESDGTAVRFRAMRTGAYAVVRLDGVAPGMQLFAEVTHLSSTAVGGLYEFSVGPQLPGDDAASGRPVRVPLVIR